MMTKEIPQQSEKEKLRKRLKHWQTLSVEQCLQWLESAMYFSAAVKRDRSK